MVHHVVDRDALLVPVSPAVRPVSSQQALALAALHAVALVPHFRNSSAGVPEDATVVKFVERKELVRLL